MKLGFFHTVVDTVSKKEASFFLNLKYMSNVYVSHAFIFKVTDSMLPTFSVWK